MTDINRMTKEELQEFSQKIADRINELTEVEEKEHCRYSAYLADEDGSECSVPIESDNLDDILTRIIDSVTDDEFNYHINVFDSEATDNEWLYIDVTDLYKIEKIPTKEMVEYYKERFGK